MLSKPHEDGKTLLDIVILGRKPCGDGAKACSSPWSVIRDELKLLVMMAAPMIVQGATQQGMLLTDQVSAYDKKRLAYM